GWPHTSAGERPQPSGREAAPVESAVGAGGWSFWRSQRLGGVQRRRRVHRSRRGVVAGAGFASGGAARWKVVGDQGACAQRPCGFLRNSVTHRPSANENRHLAIL